METWANEIDKYPDQQDEKKFHLHHVPSSFVPDEISNKMFAIYLVYYLYNFGKGYLFYKIKYNLLYLLIYVLRL